MSASHKEGKINVSDSPEVIKNKVKKAFCPIGVIENNGVLAFYKNAIFPYLEKISKTLLIERKPKFGGELAIENYSHLEKTFLEKEIHPFDLKLNLADYLIQFLKPVRKKIADMPNLIDNCKFP